MSFNDRRPEAAQLKKMQQVADSDTGHHAIQFVRPKPLSEMLAGRIGTNEENKNEVFQQSDVDEVERDVFLSARDHSLGLDHVPDTMLPQYRQEVPNAIEAIGLAVEDVQGAFVGDEESQAGAFAGRLNNRAGNLGQNARNLIGGYINKAKNKSASRQYLANLVHEEQGFNIGLNEDMENGGVQYRTPKETFFGPSQSDLNLGTEMANRVLREAFEAETQENIFFRIAVGLRAAMDSSIPGLKVTASILEHYLKPKLMNFIYRLPLADQAEDDDVWDGRTLNDGIVDENQHALDQDDTWIRPKVRDAWVQIRQIVSPAVLNAAGPVHVQADGVFSRAFYSNRVIHLGKVSSSKGTVMHEFGHHLEDMARPSHWIKLQQLMRDRAKGTELKRIFPFTIPGVISKDEMRYDVDLPASGEMGGCLGYNVKYYDYGSTEIVSTAFEVFHNREKAYKIAIKDPGMFLAVMGVLRGR